MKAKKCASAAGDAAAFDFARIALLVSDSRPPGHPRTQNRGPDRSRGVPGPGEPSRSTFCFQGTCRFFPKHVIFGGKKRPCGASHLPDNKGFLPGVVFFPGKKRPCEERPSNNRGWGAAARLPPPGLSKSGHVTPPGLSKSGHVTPPGLSKSGLSQILASSSARIGRAGRRQASGGRRQASGAAARPLGPPPGRRPPGGQNPGFSKNVPGASGGLRGAPPESPGAPEGALGAP